MLPKCAYTRMWKAFAGLFLIAGILALLKCGTYPNGPEIKIAGESIWLRYNFDRLILNIVWVIGFFARYAFSHRRLGIKASLANPFAVLSRMMWSAAATAGSVIGAYITFRLARRAGNRYLDSTLGSRRAPRFLKFFETWGTVALIAAIAIPFPLPTSLIFAVAGASNHYSTRKYLTVVALSRAAHWWCVCETYVEY